MLKNYLLIALRTLFKQKVYSAINVLGLSVGIASCILISIYIRHQFSFDTFHDKGDNIFKVALERKYPNHSTYYALIPHSFAEVLSQDLPEVAGVVRLGGPFNNTLVTYETVTGEEKQFEEDLVMAADSNFFELFSFDLLRGDRGKALADNSYIVITQETAERYFGNDEPIGKTLHLFDQDFTVSGVAENIPENSHFRFDFLAKWNDQVAGGLQSNFTRFNAHVYLELNDGADAAQIEKKLPQMVDTYAAAQIETELGKSWEEYKREGNGYRYFLQPLESIHLDPTHIEAKMRPGGNLNYVRFLICIGVLILVIAVINFTNLATARSAERGREVGVRKTMGSLKSQLVIQFITESLLLSTFSTLVAIAIVLAVLPAFSSLTGIALSLPGSPKFILLLAGTALIVGLFAGSYPAFALSSFNPVTVLKGKLPGNAKGNWLRNSLVVFQFFASIVLIVGTVTVGKQMRYFQEKSLGYQTDHLIVVERVFALNEQSTTFLDEIRRIPGVVAAGGTFSRLGREGEFFGAQFLPEGSSDILTTKGTGIDDYFTETIALDFVAGRGFSDQTNDSLSVILNETAVRALGMTDPVGKKLNEIVQTPEGTATRTLTIIGVARDFNFQTLRDPITPLSMQSTETFGGNPAFAYVRIKSGEEQRITSAIENLWKQLSPGQPFRYQFQDDQLRAQYENERRANTVFAVFAGLAIIIACVGLFGLAAYTAQQRAKEIGVRKVLGATIASVVILLTRDFTKLILIAFLFAVPTSWYIMEQWLNNFAYRIEIGIGIFLLAGGTGLLIAWVTVSYQSIKTALMDPVKSLRNE